MSGRPPIPNPILSLQDELDAGFTRQLIKEGRNPIIVLAEQAACRKPPTPEFEFRAGPVHRSQKFGRTKR